MNGRWNYHVIGDVVQLLEVEQRVNARLLNKIDDLKQGILTSDIHHNQFVQAAKTALDEMTLSRESAIRALSTAEEDLKELRQRNHHQKQTILSLEETEKSLRQQVLDLQEQIVDLKHRTNTNGYPEQR